MITEQFRIDNNAGWELDVTRFHVPERLDASRAPVVMFPGYCMNAFILAYHPRGDSLVEFIAKQGYEVWTANLRGQGETKRISGDEETTFSALAGTDIPAVFDFVHAHTLTDRGDITALGCSLGSTFLFTYLAIHEQHPITAMIAMGGPLRWAYVHPLVRVVFGSKRLAKRVYVPGTRAIARRILPVAIKIPITLSLYMNTKKIDLSNIHELTKTVEDPIPSLNAEISGWIKSRDLIVDGFNVTEELAEVEIPLLQVCANKDGVVPVDTASSAALAFGSKDITTMIVGDDTHWFAHADLFINDDAEKEVFEPIGIWLDRLP